MFENKSTGIEKNKIGTEKFMKVELISFGKNPSVLVFYTYSRCIKYYDNSYK